jgi:hypothetical protein
MRRAALVLVSVVGLSMATTGCSAVSSVIGGGVGQPCIVGTWEPDMSQLLTNMDGVSVDGSGTWTFDADGSYRMDMETTSTVSFGGNDTTSTSNTSMSGTWSVDGDTLNVDVTSSEFTLDGETTSMDEDGMPAQGIPFTCDATTLVLQNENMIDNGADDSMTQLVLTRR